jgi:hypothetical protein
MPVPPTLPFLFREFICNPLGAGVASTVSGSIYISSTTPQPPEKKTHRLTCDRCDPLGNAAFTLLFKLFKEITCNPIGAAVASGSICMLSTVTASQRKHVDLPIIH